MSQVLVKMTINQVAELMEAGIRLGIIKSLEIEALGGQ